MARRWIRYSSSIEEIADKFCHVSRETKNKGKLLHMEFVQQFPFLMGLLSFHSYMSPLSFHPFLSVRTERNGWSPKKEPPAGRSTAKIFCPAGGRSECKLMPHPDYRSASAFLPHEGLIPVGAENFLTPLRSNGRVSLQASNLMSNKIDALSPAAFFHLKFQIL